jgi:hypothetical protein
MYNNGTPQAAPADSSVLDLSPPPTGLYEFSTDGKITDASGWAGLTFDADTGKWAETVPEEETT